MGQGVVCVGRNQDWRRVQDFRFGFLGVRVEELEIMDLGVRVGGLGSNNI